MLFVRFILQVLLMSLCNLHNDVTSAISLQSPPQAGDSVCNSDPCGNGGSCERSSNNDYRCNCVGGWSGPTCTESYCSGRAAPRTKRSMASPTTYCQCEEGYSGNYCEYAPVNQIIKLTQTSLYIIEGETPSFTCTVQVPSDPVQINWFLKGTILMTSERVVISPATQIWPYRMYMSILNITNIGESDRGDLCCSTAVDGATYSANISLNPILIPTLTLFLPNMVNAANYVLNLSVIYSFTNNENVTVQGDCSLYIDGVNIPILSYQTYLSIIPNEAFAKKAMQVLEPRSSVSVSTKDLSDALRHSTLFGVIVRPPTCTLTRLGAQCRTIYRSKSESNVILYDKPSYIVVSEYCDPYSDFCNPMFIEYGQITWPANLVWLNATKPCPNSQSGLQTSECRNNMTGGLDLYIDCQTSTSVRPELTTLLKILTNGTETLNATQLSARLLSAINTSELNIVEQYVSTEIFKLIVTNVTLTDEAVNATGHNLIKVASDLLQPRYEPNWNYLDVNKPSGNSVSLMRSLDQFGKICARALKPNEQLTITADNIVLQASYVGDKKSDMTLPLRIETPGNDWSSCEVVFPAGTLNKSSVTGISTITYRTLDKLAVYQSSSNYDDENLNSSIFAVTIGSEYRVTFDPPIEIVLSHTAINGTARCVFWDFDPVVYGKGNWSDRGCTVDLTRSTVNRTVCLCNHSTNFAVLVSPDDKETLALNLISVIGCAISIVFLIITILVHTIVWKYVHSQRNWIMMHLCFMLALADILFLAGVDHVEIPLTCTIIAALLHYLFLVVFFLMLVTGIEIYQALIIVSRSKGVYSLKLLLGLAYSLPLVIIGVSLGVTQTHGYRDDKYCWLSSENYLRFAFVGPVIAICLINIIILVMVIVKIRRRRTEEEKSVFSKAKSTVWVMCVLMPMLGIGWIIGIFTFATDTRDVLQYIFAVANALQGFFIFLFHCALNKNLHEAIQNFKQVW